MSTTTPSGKQNSLANLNPGNRKGKSGLRRKVTKDVLEFFDDYLTSTRAEFMDRMSRLSDVDFVKATIDMAKFVGTKQVLAALADDPDIQQSYQFALVVHPRPQIIEIQPTEPETEATEAAEVSQVSADDSEATLIPTAVTKAGTSFTFTPDMSKYQAAPSAASDSESH